MSYDLATSIPFGCTDKRSRYRPQKQGKLDVSPRRSPRSTVPSGLSERRVQERDGGARWQRIQTLSKQLSEKLPDGGRGLWLELEEALHAHWLDVAADHYHRGFAAGAARKTLGARWPDKQSDARQQLRALIATLAEVADDLDES